MRIAQLYHDFHQRGGAERHVEALAHSLNGLGHEIIIVSEGPPAGLRGFRLDFARLRAPFSALLLAQWMRRERIEIVHAHSRIAAWIASLALRLYRVPLVVTSHILPAGLKRFSQWGDTTICVSEAVRQCLIQNYGVGERKATVIHNGIEMSADFAPSFRPLALGPQPLITFVARFAPGKGHEMFLDSASRLLSSGFPGTFVLAGDGPLEASLRARYARDRLVFLGYRNDPLAILAGSAASVVCSEAEAFPYSVLESLAVGTPVISTDCGGPAEIIRPGRNGFLYPIGDGEALGRLLVAVTAGNPGLASRREIAADCRANFSFRRMVDATLGVYRKSGVRVQNG